VELLDGEMWYPPDALSQDPHHGAHVIELHPTPSATQLGDDQAGVACRGRFPLRVAPLPFLGKRTEEPLDQLERRCRSNVLREVATAWHEDTVYLPPVRPHRMPCRHQVE